MSHRGPLLTLSSGVVLAAVMLTLSTQAHSRGTAAAPATAPAPTSSRPSASAQVVPSPASPSPSVSKPPPASGNAVYAGRMTGGGATVAIVVKNGKALAYVCDGDRTEAWLHGAAGGNRMTLTGAPGGRLSATYTSTKATGDVTAAGHHWRFTAPAVHKPSGLWRGTATVRGATVRAGWVVLADGTQVGVATVDGKPAPAPAFDVGSNTASIDGGSVTVSPADPTS